MEPEKYFKYIRTRSRRDEYDDIDQAIQSLADQDPVLCNQVFEVVLHISAEILPRSHRLTQQYIEMDQKLRAFEKRNEGLSSPEIDAERNQIKQPYEILQLNFENFFAAYTQRVAFLVESDGMEISNNMQENIAKRKTEIIQVLYEGIRNPVVASALHQHCNPYLTVISFIMNAMEKPDDHPRGLDTSSEQHQLLSNVVDWLVIQVGNIRKIVQADFGEIANKDDINPVYCNSLELFEVKPKLS
jgi:hypothetical protein